MAGEITALIATKNDSQPVLAFSPTEVFSADSSGDFTHLWEISKPRVCAPNYGETAKMQAFGNFIGTTAAQYDVVSTAQNGYKWRKNAGAWSQEKLITGDSIPIEFGIQIRFFATSAFTGYETWTFFVFKPVFNIGQYTRWQFAPYEDSVFFVNQYNTLRWINGRTINTFAWSTDSVPMGLHIMMFHGHIFISEPNYQGLQRVRTVIWSDLREFMKFDPQLFINEADEYTFDDNFDASENVLGVTGMATMAPIRAGFGPDKAVIYTSKCIYFVEYVGLPHIMQKTVWNDKVGCAFPYGLVATRFTHMFPGEDNFYKMDRNGDIEPIGDRIFGAFMHLLSRDVKLRYRTYGYVDQVRREVWWVFCSTKSTGKFDMKVGYNYISDTWQFAQADEHAFLHTRIPTTTTPISADTTIIYLDSTIIADDGEQSFLELRLYGQENKKVSYEVTDDQVAIDQTLDEPYLETGDIIYDPGKVITVDGMYIHADYDPATCIGIEVAYVGRANVASPLIWQKPPQLWTTELKENKFSWPRVSAKVHRFRFTFKKKPGALAVRRAEFYFWNEIVKGMNEESEK